MSELPLLIGYECIYFQYSEHKNIYTIYCIDFALLFAVITCLKGELVFHCRMLNDIYDCDNDGTVT